MKYYFNSFRLFICAFLCLVLLFITIVYADTDTIEGTATSTTDTYEGIADTVTDTFEGQTVASGGYDAHLMFLWDSPSSTTVDYSAGDSTGTPQDTVQITGGAVDTNDTGSNGDDHYRFNVSAGDIIDEGGTGTVFCRFYFESNSASNDSIWAVYTDFNDWLIIDLNSTEIQVIYTDNNVQNKVCTTSGASLSTGNWYWVRVAFQVGSTPYMTIEVYNDSAGSMGSSITSGTNSTDNWDTVTAAGTDAFRVGNYYTAVCDRQISYIAVYDDIRATEP